MDEDDALMDRLKQGETQAFDELVERHFSGLRYYFQSRSHSVRDRQMAEDLAQEVLIRVLNESRNFNPCGRFRSWMYRIARNLLIDTVRKESYDALIGGKTSGDQDEVIGRLPDETRAIVDQADCRELADIVDELLDELPEDQRMTFKIYHYLGLTLPEVAAILETNTATTKSRLRLARDKLQERLRELQIEPDEAL